jgi:hypothetical protein
MWAYMRLATDGHRQARKASVQLSKDPCADIPSRIQPAPSADLVVPNGWEIRHIVILFAAGYTLTRAGI